MPASLIILLIAFLTYRYVCCLLSSLMASNEVTIPLLGPNAISVER